MKREKLKELGLTDEQINEVMTEHGKTVEKHKASFDKANQDLDTYKEKLGALETQLTDANTQIQSFKDMDVEGIKKSADEWKTKYEAETQELQKQMEAREYGYNLDKAMSGYKFSNDRVRSSILADIKEKQFKYEGEKFLGLDDYMKQLRDNEPTSFVSDEPTEPTPQIVKPTNGGTTPPQGQGFGFASMFTGVRSKENN